VSAEHITAVLYDMALVVGREVSLRPLLQKTLQRLLYHTSYPVGLVLLGPVRDAAPGSGEVEVRLELAIGESALSGRSGALLTLPRALVTGPAEQRADPALLAGVPRAGALPYTAFLRLPVGSDGVIVLLSPREPRAQLPLDRIFQPVMANLARAITLCRDHEAYTTGLLAERDAARHGLERFRAALDTSGDVIAVVDAATGRFVDFNAAAQTTLGYGRGELLALRAGDVVAELEAVRERELDALLDGARREVTFEALHRRKDGTTYPAEVRLTAFRCRGEQPLLIAVSRDVTARKAIEQQLQQSQKLESVARLAGGVAHDFNNLLTAILGGVDVLLEGIPAGEPLHDEVQEIETAARRAASLTRQLLVFSRKEAVQPALVDLNEVVAGMARMLRRLIGEDVELVTAHGPGLGRVRADPGQLEQVIVNLAVNARDAMPRGGRLAIETGSVELGLETAQLHGVRPGRHVLLAVSDSGCGMSPEVQAHLFEPFFTTKAAGKGTGLGLSTVYGIVKQAGGYVGLTSHPGRGTTFRIYLPEAQGPAERGADAAVEAEAELPRGTEHVLLVEDDPLVRRVVGRALRAAGYAVVEATEGWEALRLVREGRPVDLLVADLVMPHLGGDALARHVRAEYPGTKVLLISGYTDHVAQVGALGSAVAFLQKPFTSLALARKVRELLERPVAAATAPAPSVH
jgi:PAS domain S-box-containing protein